MNISKIREQSTLIEYLNQGHPVKYFFFWGHQPNKDGTIGKSCFSQWYEAGFELEGIYYRTAEHYMMAEKARLFHDMDALEEIIQAKSPAEAKKLGRTVQRFQDEQWCEHRFEIVVRGNLAKFTQNDALREFILNTGEQVLVEASPRDRIWGIGMGAKNLNAKYPEKWRGLNLLGFALMEARGMIQRESKN